MPTTVPSPSLSPTKKQAASTATTQIPLRNASTEEQVKYLSKAGNKIMLNGTELTIVSYDAATNTVTVSQSVTYGANYVVYSTEGGAIRPSYTQPDVHVTLVFGADAYGVIDIDGSGTMETIIKPHGSEGSGDPLNQRATVGAKVAAYAAKVLNPLWIVRIEHTVSD